MVMIKNPRQETNYYGKWNNKDSVSWTSEFISQVPYGINPLESADLGILFIEINRIKDCFI